MWKAGNKLGTSKGSIRLCLYWIILRDSRAVRRPPTQLVTPRAPLLVAFFGVLCLMPSLGRRVRADSVLMESWSDKGGFNAIVGGFCCSYLLFWGWDGVATISQNVQRHRIYGRWVQLNAHSLILQHSAFSSCRIYIPSKFFILFSCLFPPHPLFPNRAPRYREAKDD